MSITSINDHLKEVLKSSILELCGGDQCCFLGVLDLSGIPHSSATCAVI